MSYAFYHNFVKILAPVSENFVLNFYIFSQIFVTLKKESEKAIRVRQKRARKTGKDKVRKTENIRKNLKSRKLMKKERRERESEREKKEMIDTIFKRYGKFHV